MHVNDDDDDDVGKDGYDDENYNQDVDLFQRMRKQFEGARQYRARTTIFFPRAGVPRSFTRHIQILALGLTPIRATPHYTHKCV